GGSAHQQLPDRMSGKQPAVDAVIDQVSLPQPPRFLAQAEEPFEPAFLHPGGRLLLGAGMEVKRRTDTQLYAADRVAVLVGEFFLPWAPGAQEDQPGAAFVNLAGELLILLGRDRAERR